MPLTTAERQKRFREKMKANPETAEKLKKKKHEYYIKRRKPIGLSTDREKRLIRRGWKANQRARRKRIKDLENATVTPTLQSPAGNQGASISKSSSMNTIRKKYWRNIFSANRTVSKLRAKLRLAQKRYSRLRLQQQATKRATNAVSTTPRSKSNYVMSHSPSTVRKTLIFHHALVEELRDSNKRHASGKDRQILAKVLSGKILKKYKLLSVAKREFSFRRRQILRTKSNDGGSSLQYIPRMYERFHLKNAKLVVHQFFLEDIHSRATAGKNETITRNKEKKQKRYLNGTVKALHKTFCAKRGPISYSAFRKLKPFWVVESVDRDTCACKKCENIKLKIAALHRLGEISTSNVIDLLLQITCSVDNQSCMYSQCNLCRSKSVVFSENLTNDSPVTWFEWIAKTEKRSRRQADGSDKSFIVHIVTKEKKGRNSKKSQRCSLPRSCSIFSAQVQLQTPTCEIGRAQR